MALKVGSAALVAAAEAKLRGEAVDPAVYRAALDGLLAQPGGDRMDIVVLACTHFPLLSDELTQALGRDVAFVDGAAGIARRIRHLTQGQEFARIEPDMAVTTGPLDDFARLAPAFAVQGITRLERF